MARSAFYGLFLVAAMTANGHAQDTGNAEPGPTIQVSGEGIAEAAPDIASVSLAVETAARTAEEALEANSRAVSGVIAALDAAGVAARDRQTQGFTVQPLYTRPDRGETPELQGYQVRNGLAVRVRDLDALGGILDAAIEAGANRVGSVAFWIDNADALLAEARSEAIADATLKARTYAEAAGLSLGSVLSITEGAPGAPERQGMALRSAAVSDVPIERGEAAVSAQVTVRWALIPAE